MSKISPCLWFDGEGRGGREILCFAAAGFADRDSAEQPDRRSRRQGGLVLVVELTLAGQRFIAFSRLCRDAADLGCLVGTSMATFNRLMLFQSWI